MKKWTVTVELKTGTEYVVAVKADTASQAKEIVRRTVEVQYTKNSRPYQRETDESLPRLNW